MEIENSLTSEAEYPYYSRAPITEAIIDLRVDAPCIDVEILTEVGKTLGLDYPDCEPLRDISFTLNLDSSPQKVEASSGYKYKDKTGKKVVLARASGFTFSQLAPYETWEPFCADARHIWEVYKAVVKPKTVTRLAVRFINRIDIAPGEEFSLYLKTYPRISEDMSQTISNFFMQLELPQKDIESTALINQTVMSSFKPDSIALLLDIDLFKNDDFGTDEDKIWAFFKKLRLRKDQIFEACITDRVREGIR